MCFAQFFFGPIIFIVDFVTGTHPLSLDKQVAV